MSPRPAVLALIAGWMDPVALLQTHVFAGAMSGNTILLSISIGQRHWGDAGWRALTVGSFFAASVLARVLSRRWRTPGPAILLSTALVLLAAAPGVMPRGVLLLAAAMALLNAASTRYGDVSLNTSFVTGDTVKLADAVAGRLVLRGGGRQQPRDMLSQVPAVWLCYAAGAVLGTLATLALNGGGAVPRSWNLPLLPPAVALPLTLLLPRAPSGPAPGG